MLKGKVDFILVLLVVGFAIFGVLMVFSASYYDTLKENGNPYYYLRLAAMWAGVGLVVMIFVSFIDYKLIRKLAPYLMVVALILLVAVLTKFGVTINHAKRWIGIGSFTFMPGEWTKPAIIVFFAWYYTRIGKGVRSITRGLLMPMVLVGAIVMLIYKEPNLSTAIIILGISVCMMFFAGCDMRPLFLLLALAIGVLALLVLMNPEGEHYHRFVGYLDPFSDAKGEFYQLVQSLLSLGSGGLFGQGLGNSVGKALYLPEAQNDFIFAIVGEELGFVGCIIVIFCYLCLIYRCAKISIGAPDRFGMLVGCGITSMMAIQVIVNIAVVTGVFPPTGVTLPFISYGGNATVMYMGCMGIMLSISKSTYREVFRGDLPRKSRSGDKVNVKEQVA